MSTDVMVPERVEVAEGWNPQGEDRVGSFVAGGKERLALATHIAKGGLTHHKTPEAVLTIMLAAYEMGVPVMQALRGMYVVKGKLALEGHLMDGLAISRCGVSKKVEEKSATRCRIRFSRPGWEDHTEEYDLHDAARAGLVRDVKPDGSFTTGKGPWREHPKQMLYWRCLGHGLRIVAPDFFGGMYHEDELAHVVSRDSGTSEAARDLDALKRGVEPHPDLMTLDEIDQYTTEIERAVKEGHFTKAEAKALKALMVAGEWTEAREALESLRMKILGASEQPGLDL